MGKITTKLLITDSSVLGERFKTKLIEAGYEAVSLNGMGITAKDMTQSFFLDEQYGTDVIFHTAEKTPYEINLEESEDDFMKYNLIATKNLCSAIERWSNKPKVFIFISSVCVYGASQGDLINENHPLNGNSFYAKSKIAAEEFIIDWAYRHQVTLSILRLPVLIADNPPRGLLGIMFHAIKSRKYIGFGNGNARRSVLWAPDMVNLFAKISQLEGIYNLTDGLHPSCKELEQVIAKKMHVGNIKSMPLAFAKPLALLGDWIGHPFSLTSKKLEEATESLTYDDLKARTAFNWNPSSVIEKLADTQN